MRRTSQVWLPILLVCFATTIASAQSFRVQCPTSTITHPTAANNNGEPTYAGPTYSGNHGYPAAPDNVNGAIKCQQISGGDGYATMGDGTQTYLFSFGPLSSLAHIAAGNPDGAYGAGSGAEFPNVFNTLYSGATPLQPGDPATTDGAVDSPYNPGNLGAFTFDGAVGLVNNVANLASIFDISEVGTTVTVVLNTQVTFRVGDQVVISGQDTAGYNGTWTIDAVGVANPFFPANFAFSYTNPTTGLAEVSESATATAGSLPGVDGHVETRQIMDVGVMNGNLPAPLMALDEDDEFFLTLTNVGMIMRPDLFEQHTVHFHGYPNASSFYDGVPDASVAINIGASFTYYYLAPDAGTYFWHCHITPPEHLQMGMVGQLYVRPRQNRVSGSLSTGLLNQQGDLRTACRRTGDGGPALPAGTSTTPDILCSNPMPVVATTATNNGTTHYAYNDGDGSTYYDVEYPLQMHGFDPNFHFVGMTFNPEMFVDMKDKYFLLNGRSYPDTVGLCGGAAAIASKCVPGPQATTSSDTMMHYSQPMPALINIPAGGKASLRLVNLSVSEYHTLASLGIPMKVIGFNAKLLRDQGGNNTEYYTNSITLGGGESLDVILDASNTAMYPPGSVFYLFTPQLDHLSNDAENFGGLMTEVHICPGKVVGTTFGNYCN